MAISGLRKLKLSFFWMVAGAEFRVLTFDALLIVKDFRVEFIVSVLVGMFGNAFVMPEVFEGTCIKEGAVAVVCTSC